MKQTISNPARPGARRPVTVITDRAKRYRAQVDILERNDRCKFCGNPSAALMVGHIDGDESHGEPRNLTYVCRSCNTKQAAHFTRRGAGRKTRQYNPGPGALSLAQYLTAVMTLKGESDQMTLSAARQLVRDTPAELRSSYASEIWRRRKARFGRRGRP